MSALSGKWKRVSCDNADAVIKELVGDDAAKTAKLKAYYEQAEVIDEVTVTAEGTRRKTYIAGKLTLDLETLFGKEVERETFFGKSKLYGELKSDSCIEVKETGLDHPSSLYVFFVKDGKLYAEQTVNGVKCTRIAEKV